MSIGIKPKSQEQKQAMFDMWLQDVDAMMQSRFIFGIYDMPDWHWMQAFEDGLTAKEAVEAYAEEL